MTERRNHCSCQRCQICGRPPLYYVGAGDGWVVRHWPGRDAWLRLPIVEATKRPLKGIAVLTCGAEACIRQAQRYGAA